MGSWKRNLHLAVPLAFAAQLAYGQAGGLPGETSARQAADTELQNSINAEAAARAAGDTQLQNTINAEAAGRSAADTGLRNSINDETAARALGEARLQGNIDAEAGARTAGDANLQTQIDQLRNNGGGNGGGTVTVDCGAGQTVSQALASGAKQIIVRGACHESVTIAKDDVTLQADPAGGRIDGPDPDTNTVQVTGNRVTIDGLTVTGGRNGITALGAANMALRRCLVQSTGRTGIVYANGASGSVDQCTAQSNARDGIAADGAQTTITNSTASSNTRFGIIISNGSTARVGLTDRFVGAGNIISQNGGAGVVVSLGSAAIVAMNSITDNGTISTSSTRAGVSINQSTASIAGGNTIARNAGTGVVAFGGASVQVGDSSFGLPTLNTISRNGNTAQPGGITVILGSTMVVRDAVIEENNGQGLLFSTRSQGQLINTVIRNNVDAGNNTGDGIRLTLGSGVLPLTPGSTVTGNQGFGLQCTDGESSAVNTFAPIVTFAGNGRGDVPNCSGF